jgi:hypothetical protein
MQSELEQQKARLSALEAELKAAIMADLDGFKVAA